MTVSLQTYSFTHCKINLMRYTKVLHSFLVKSLTLSYYYNLPYYIIKNPMMDDRIS
jgi:hypothetical protein